MKARFKNDFCEFSPYAVAEIGDDKYAVGFKAVTADTHKSLGLRGNRKNMTDPDKRILTYEDGKWVEVEQDKLVPENVDWGGLWCGRTPSDAKKIAQYYERYGEAVVIPVLMEEPIYAKPDRIKCRAVFSLGELNNETSITSLAEKFRIKILT